MYCNSNITLHIRVAVLKPLPPGSEVHGTVTLGEWIVCVTHGKYHKTILFLKYSNRTYTLPLY